MLANLAASLIKHGRVKTTDAKAKEVRPFVERMVTFARRGDLHARRVVLSRLRDPEAVKKLFDEIGPQYADRMGGYTRILKLGFRRGDNAPVSLIEFVTEEVTKKAPKRKKKAAPKTQPKPAEDVAATEADVAEEAAAEETVAEEAVEAAPAEAPVEEAAETEADEKQDDAPAETAEAASAESEEAPADEAPAADEKKDTDEAGEEKA